MKSYSQTNVFTAWDRAVLARATALVELIPDSPRLRCHEIARIVDRLVFTGDYQGIERHVVDGHYGCVEHSWIHFIGTQHILDPYAVGRLPMVQLVDLFPIDVRCCADPSCPIVGGKTMRGVYRGSFKRLDIDEDAIGATIKDLLSRFTKAELRLT